MNGSRRFLIVTWEGGGNVPPAIALGQRLTMAGHRVTVLGPASATVMASAAGVRLVAYESVRDAPTDESFDDNDALFKEVLHGDGVARDMVEVATREQAEVVVIDCMMGAAFAAAERLGLPTAVLVHVLYRPFVEQWGQFVLDAVTPRAGLGLPAAPSLPPSGLLAAADLVMALTPPGFDFDGADIPANTHYVGPILFPTPPGRRPEGTSGSDGDSPLVLISFSTTLQGQRAALPPVLDAIGQLPVRAVLTLGGVLQPDEITAPANVEVVPYIPHASVLPRAAAVVCHGGLSTIMASLSHGVPLLCIPQGREQPLNSERVRASGTGQMLPSDANPHQIATAVNALIEDPAYRAAATTHATQIGDCENLATRLVAALPR